MTMAIFHVPMFSSLTILILGPTPFFSYLNQLRVATTNSYSLNATKQMNNPPLNTMTKAQ